MIAAITSRRKQTTAAAQMAMPRISGWLMRPSSESR
jgi:hypothetical protein